MTGPRFFEKDLLISADTLPFSTRDKCLAMAVDKPDTLVTFLSKAFSDGEIQEGKHPIVGDLIHFAKDVRKAVRDIPPYTPDKHPVLDCLKIHLTTYYTELAKSDPGVAATLFKKEDDVGRLLYGEHFLFGPLDKFNEQLLLPETHPVKKCIQTAIDRRTMAFDANYHPNKYREMLENAKTENTIVEGIHPTIGNLTLFGWELYQIAPAVEDTGPNQVLSYLSKIGAWYYPSPEKNPIDGQSYLSLRS